MKTVVFWIVAIMGANWALALVATTFNPDWYYDKRTRSGLAAPKSLTQFFIIKIVQVGLVAAFLSVLGEDLGYWG